MRSSERPRPERRIRWREALAMVLAAGLAGIAAGAGGPEAGEGRELRSFDVHNRPLDEAYRVIAPLLSGRGDVRLVRSEGRIEVLDEPARLGEIARVLAAFDIPPRRVRLQVRVVKGERREGGAPAPARGVPADVRELLGYKYNSFESLGMAEIALSEGQAGEGLVGSDERFRVSVRLGAIDAASGAVVLKLLSFEHRLLGADGSPLYRPLFQLSEELQPGRFRVLGATPSAADRRALFLVVSAEVD